jgi:alanine dehydrogenase
VVVLGGGVVGTNAARGHGHGRAGHGHRPLAAALRQLDQFGGRLHTRYSNAMRSRRRAGCRPGDRRGAGAGCRGAQAGHAATWCAACAPAAVLVDVAIDQGGCFETSRPTTHAEPTFVE